MNATYRYFEGNNINKIITRTNHEQTNYYFSHCSAVSIFISK